MFPFWAPLSMLTLGDPPLPATAFVLRRLLGRGRAVALVYRGDRMHPAVRHGQTVEVRPAGTQALLPGDVVLALPDGVPDLVRVQAAGREGIALAADSDPAFRFVLPADCILGKTDLPRRSVSPARRLLRRLAIDWREARGGGIDAGADPADSVRRKYDEQAPWYGQASLRGVVWPLQERVRRAVRAGGRILVAGSGTGRECFVLEEDGYEVAGIDFSPQMVALAREQAAARGSGASFARADLRTHDEPPGSLDAVIFTYDVYSFIPGRVSRIEVLRRLAGWLRPGGVIYLSARRARGLYSRAILARAWMRRGGAVRREFGDVHSRWISADGAIRRSFVECFTARSLAAEIRRAGLAAGPWESGHAELRAVSDAISGSRTPIPAR